ncbi:hypothetical protein LPJ61_000893 [Coemansia biformis]|uniref:Mid2 domain-containing protein n=1 Tax=Coemansia biformis TaxID=1286918 RepID=A0A9W7YFW8_9FUNG|nr:hypothetical protein LPJ61_000893 [Coemansia biformis]
MRVSTTARQALAAAALLVAVTAAAGAEGAAHSDARALQPERGAAAPSLHPRAFLDNLLKALNPNREPRAGESGGASDPATATNDNNNTDNNGDTTAGGETTDAPSTSTSASTRTTSTRTTRTSSRETSSANDRTTESKTSATPTKTSTDTRTGTRTSTDTQASTETSTEPPSSTPDSTSLVVTTVTGPGITRTTVVGPPPTIDGEDGNKADVGVSSNLTSIIVASTVTAVALLVCTVLYYVYRYRKNRKVYNNEDFFGKGGPVGSLHSRAGNTAATTSPFITPGHPPSDGYVKEANGALYSEGALSAGRRTEELYRPQQAVADNTHLLSSQPYRPGAAPYAGQPAAARYHPPPPVSASAGPPQTAAPAGYYGAPQGGRQLTTQQLQQLHPQQQRNVFSLQAHNHGAGGGMG